MSEPDGTSARIRSWAALLTAVAGLATAVWKPPNHDATRASYQELSSAIDKLSAQVSANHDDVTTLRGYIAGKAGEGLVGSLPMAVTIEPGPAADAGAPVSLKGLGGAGRGAGGRVAPKPAVRAVDEPPPVHEPPAPVHAADFDSVLKTLK